ncbi:MAG: DUF983 domain-containing protein [Bacteroidia bacterium]
MCDLYEPSKGLSIMKAKCPQCQSGKMFTHSAFNLSKFTSMNETCPVCKLKFEIEPGFFWGAMYVSYALTVGLMLVLGGAILFFSSGKAGFYTYIIPIISALILSSPVTYRYSRVLMIHLFSPIRFIQELANKK